MKRQQINFRKARIGTKGVPWIYWQRKCQVHRGNLILYKPKFKYAWKPEMQTEMLEDYLYCLRMALKYKDRGYHKVHREHRDDAKKLLKALKDGKEGKNLPTFPPR
jgi:hypothetical protein